MCYDLYVTRTIMSIAGDTRVDSKTQYLQNHRGLMENTISMAVVHPKFSMNKLQLQFYFVLLFFMLRTRSKSHCHFDCWIGLKLRYHYLICLHDGTRHTSLPRTNRRSIAGCLHSTSVRTTAPGTKQSSLNNTVS